MVLLVLSKEIVSVELAPGEIVGSDNWSSMAGLAKAFDRNIEKSKEMASATLACL